MKILLLEHPRSVAAEHCNDIANTPLCSCLLSGYTAAMLKKDGHDVEIIEGFLDSLSYDDVWATISAYKPDVLGVHMVYNWEKDLALYAFLAHVKNELGPHIVAYGFYPTIAYEDILTSCPAIDAVIAGEPELAMARLAASKLKAEQVALIPGLVLRDGAGGFQANKPEVIQDLDSMPFPVRTDALMRLSEVNILGSRGCYGRCTFCYINTFFTRSGTWRRRSPENIMEEIDGLIVGEGVRDFYFTDANFFGPGSIGQERALQIATLLKERNVRFGIEGRVNDIHDETIAALRSAGLRHMLIGLESGRDESLKRLNKLTTVAQNEEALRILRKHGIEPNVGFIMFEPDSTLDDLRVNFEFLKRNGLLGDLARTANVLYHHQIILEGTAAYHYLRQKGRLVTAGSNYEGTTYFENPRVATLAGIMRRITNKLFSALDDIWSGRVPEPDGAKAGYDKLNRLVVTTFEENLTALQSGETLSERQASAIVKGAEKEIEEIVSRVKRGKPPERGEA